MKVRVTFKDPDGVWESVEESVREELSAVPGLSDSEREMLVCERRDTVFEKIGKWVKYKEYVTVEFDTDAGTAKVVEN